MFGTIDAEGHLMSAYSREETALLNAGDFDVVEVEQEVVIAADAWRYDRKAKAWGPLKQRRVRIDLSAPTDYVGRRRRAYGQQLDMDRQLEAIVEALMALFEGKTIPPKLAAILAEIAAVKAQHPKP